MCKKILSAVLVALLLLSVLPCTAYASEPTYQFELEVGGTGESRAEPGDVITVSLYVYRTDSDESYDMHGMQAEIRYDTTFFRLVGDSAIVTPGIVCHNVEGVDRYDEVYMNFLSLTGGDKWEAKRFIGSFQLEVTSKAGISKISLEDTLVSRPDGKGSYKCKEVEHVVIVSTECTVIFEANGGAKVADQIVIYGEKIAKPADPVREGYVFVGWYKDIHLQEPWDFENDVVESSMPLYAKWVTEGTPLPTEATGPNTSADPTDATIPTNGPVDLPAAEQDPIIFWGIMVVAALAAICIILLLVSRKRKEKQEANSQNIQAEAQEETQDDFSLDMLNDILEDDQSE